MRLSLSVRIAEGFLSKEQATMGLEELADLARGAGYDSICMRASQVGVHSTAEDVERAAQILSQRQLSVSMVTGDFDIVYNNDKGPDCLRRMPAYLKLARALGASLLRVALKRDEHIGWARQAADLADRWGIRLAHQCHTLSLFETVEGIEQTLRKIDRPNFGLIFEPANLELCGQDYGPNTIKRLAPWILNVYLQNQRIHPDGNMILDTWSRGPVAFDVIQIHDSGGIDFDRVFDGLSQIQYDGTITVHQSAPDGQSSSESATATAQFLRERLPN